MPCDHKKSEETLVMWKNSSHMQYKAVTIPIVAKSGRSHSRSISSSGASQLGDYIK